MLPWDPGVRAVEADNQCRNQESGGNYSDPPLDLLIMLATLFVHLSGFA